MIRCKDLHAVEGRHAAFGGQQATPHHLVLWKCARGLHGALSVLAATLEKETTLLFLMEV